MEEQTNSEPPALHKNPVSKESGSKRFTKPSKKMLIVGVVVVLVIIGAVAAFLVSKKDDSSNNYFNFQQCLDDQTALGSSAEEANKICLEKQGTGTASTIDPEAGKLGDANSLDPILKGKSLSGGQCEGSGTVPLSHAPMDIKDVATIQPMGYTAEAHVTPIDHQYYYQVNNKAPKDTYPVYATADGNLTSVQHIDNAWFIVLSHSCTFYTQYNLITGFAPDLQKLLPSNWSPTSGSVKVPVKAGQVIGYVGGQSLDFSVWNTEKTVTGLLNKIAYNNREPWKVNTVPPLDYFTPEVKAAVLQRYVRTAEPRDGKFDYDVDGQAVGNWFVAGTNGYAGGEKIDNSVGINYYGGHLALTYDYIDPTGRVFSIGNYEGKPAQFAVKNAIDWTKIVPGSGVAKIELAERQHVTANGTLWSTAYATGIKMTAGPSKGTALVEMTDKQVMKVEVFPGKTPAQVSGFTSAAKTYNRGQDAHMVNVN